MTAISVSERLLEMAAFYTPLALTVTSFFIPKIKKGGQAQWQNLNPLTNSELILASG